MTRPYDHPPAPEGQAAQPGQEGKTENDSPLLHPRQPFFVFGLEMRVYQRPASRARPL